MRAKLTRPDGTVVELEGADDEVLKAILALSPPPPAPFVLVQPLVAPYVAPQPTVVPGIYPVSPWPPDIIVGMPDVPQWASPNFTTCTDKA